MVPGHFSSVHGRRKHLRKALYLGRDSRGFTQLKDLPILWQRLRLRLRHPSPHRPRVLGVVYHLMNHPPHPEPSIPPTPITTHYLKTNPHPSTRCNPHSVPRHTAAGTKILISQRSARHSTRCSVLACMSVLG